MIRVVKNIIMILLTSLIGLLVIFYSFDLIKFDIYGWAISVLQASLCAVWWMFKYIDFDYSIRNRVYKTSAKSEARYWKKYLKYLEKELLKKDI